MQDRSYAHLVNRAFPYGKSPRNTSANAGNLRELGEKGEIELVGASKGYPGVSGMIVFKTETGKEARSFANENRWRSADTRRANFATCSPPTRRTIPAIAVGKARLHVELLDERSPFLEGTVADGVFHLAGFLFCDFGIYPQVFGEKLQQQLVAAENGGTVFVAFVG